MAKQTRAERRARREAAAASRGEAPELAAPAPREAPHGEERAGRRLGLPRGTFVRESIGELRKVEWPGQSQVLQGTVVVLIACVIIGSYLYVADQVFRRFVENVLLGQ